MGVNDSIYNDFGVALRELKRYLSAIQKFDEAIKINPSNHLVYYNKANLYLEISEFEKAELNFTTNVLIFIKIFTQRL